MSSDAIKWMKTPFGLILDYEMPAECNVVVLCVHKHQWVPVRIFLPHQIYKEMVQRLLEERGSSEIAIIPYDSNNLISFKGNDLFPGDS